LYGSDCFGFTLSTVRNSNARIFCTIRKTSHGSGIKQCLHSLKVFYNLIDIQIKRDASGNSKGFGFIRYEDYSSQAKALAQRHYVNNRWVEVKIPASKVIFF